MQVTTNIINLSVLHRSINRGISDDTFKFNHLEPETDEERCLTKEEAEELVNWLNQYPDNFRNSQIIECNLDYYFTQSFIKGGLSDPYIKFHENTNLTHLYNLEFAVIGYKQ